jgi:hypothetical protein
LLGSDKEHEREGARKKLDALLKRNRKSWNDLTELPASGGETDERWDFDDAARTSKATPITGAKEKDFNALELTHWLIEGYLDVKPHEAIVIALWVLHTHVDTQFGFTPRLTLTSPVRGCGKTTLLRLIELLDSKTERMDGVSSAAIYWQIDQRSPTLLVDEADNLGLGTSGALCSVMNSGHLRGGGVGRVIQDSYKKFSTFAPMAQQSVRCRSR